MYLKRLRKAGKKYGKKYFRVIIVSVVVAAVLTAVAGEIGNLSQLLLIPRLAGLPLFVLLYLQLFVGLFGIGLLLGLLRKNSQKLRSKWTKSVGEPLSQRWKGLSRRLQAILLGLLVAVLAGGTTAAVDLVYPIPLAVSSGVSLLAWPIGTYWALTATTSTETEASVMRSLSVRSRYAKLRQLETRTIALLVGFVIAAVTGGGIRWLGVNTVSTVGVAGLVWLVAAIVVYNQYETATTTRTELEIIATETTAATDTIEVSIKNSGVETVTLPKPTLKDTNNELYVVNKDLRLQPGDRDTIRLPSVFSLAPSDVERTLPLGYTLDRSQQTPTIYSQTGCTFELQQQDTNTKTAAWTDRGTEHTSQSTAVPNMAGSQD